MSAVVKRRLVKLVVNFLFYFRTDEAEVGRRGGGSRAGVWDARVARPSASSAPSPSEPCCWSIAESPRKSPPASPLVSAGGDPPAPLLRSPGTKSAVPGGAPPFWGRLCAPSQARPRRPPPPRPPELLLLLGIPAFWVFPTVISPVLSGLVPATLEDFLGSPGEGRICRKSKSFD